jgi:aminoglycoside/choline kinase family phosphotransferase
MTENKYPEGWNEERVKKLIEHYKNQTEEEAVAEDEAAFENEETVMNIPRELVPKVRKLIAEHEKAS